MVAKKKIPENTKFSTLDISPVEELPLPYRKARNLNSFWGDVQNALREYPERWFRIKRYSKSTASTTARQFTEGKRAGFIPEEWEAKSVAVSEKEADLYLRYTGV